MHHPDNHPQHFAAQASRGQGIRQPVQPPASQAPPSQAARIRSLQSEESWVDISSRNSSSSLSSVGGDDTLIPVHGGGPTQFARRRRLQRSLSTRMHDSNATFPTLATDSSQEEYEESESEQDQVLTSSNEDILRPDDEAVSESGHRIDHRPASESSDVRPGHAAAYSTSDQHRQSDSRLAATFRPQPNAFTHPPNVRHANSSQPEYTSHVTSGAPMTRAASANATVVLDDGNSPTYIRPTPRSSYSSSNTVRPRSHTPYNMIAPSHTVSVDHDAALRASLSTLLSCAAARRGAPKRESAQTYVRHPLTQQAAPGTLRLVPESQLDREEETLAETQDANRVTPDEVNVNFPTRPSRKTKSKSPARGPAHKRHRSSAIGTSSATELDSAALSPTTLWFIGVGALFLGGAALFTAGYMQGREIGYVEGLSDAGQISCRKEVASDGLKGMGRRGWRSAAGASIWGIS